MKRTAAIKIMSIVSITVLAFPIFIAALRIASDPDVPFLFSDGGAEWIEVKRHFNLGIWDGNQGVMYRKEFVVEKTYRAVILTVKAFRTAQVYLDEKPVLPFNDIKDWKNPRSVDLKQFLTPGLHEIRIVVLNHNGPPVVLAYSQTLGLFTGPNWEASEDGTAWGPVSVVNERKTAVLSQRFSTTFSALLTLLPLYFPLFLVCFIILLLLPAAERKIPAFQKVRLRPSFVRWVLIAAWTLIAANNIAKIPLHVGFDVPDHYAYISYIAKKGTIPLATEGWQMFQSPLYYLFSAVLQLALAPLFNAENMQIALRIIPLFCGAMQVELTYRAMGYVFPGRDDLRALGTMLGGLLPMNLYLSQFVGNEPLSGVLSSAVIVMALGLLDSETGPLSRQKLLALGTLLGLALLTKITALLLVPPVMLLLLHSMLRKGVPLGRIINGMFLCLGVVTAVAGWYYIRNWIELGRPFVGGWDAYLWWQDPGYRTMSDFLSFGESLIHPVLSTTNGFWDALYSSFWLDGTIGSTISYKFRPPWNYNFMISGAFLSVLPTAGILLGLIMAVGRPKTAKPGQIFSTYSVALYFSALLYLYTTLPIYSTAKATYTIGLVPCYAILCMTGLDVITRNRYIAAAVSSLLICWAVASYCSYFVL